MSNDICHVSLGLKVPCGHQVELSGVGIRNDLLSLTIPLISVHFLPWHLQADRIGPRRSLDYRIDVDGYIDVITKSKWGIVIYRRR